MQPSPKGQASHRLTPVPVAVGLCLLLGACSTVEEALPFGLLRGVPQQSAEERLIAPRDASADRYPSLASVPEHPARFTPADERAVARDRLTAERDAAIARDARLRAGAPGATESAHREAIDASRREAPPRFRPGGGELVGPPADRGAAHSNQFTVGVIAFPTGSAALPSEARERLRRVAELHAERGGRLRVVGHSSSRTRDMAATDQMIVNYRLSVDRAAAVAEALIGLGVDANAIVMTAVGDTDPEYYETMPDGQLRNQRVVIILENPAG